MLAAFLGGSLGLSLVSYWLAKVPVRMLCFAGYYRISLLLHVTGQRYGITEKRWRLHLGIGMLCCTSG